MRYGYCLTCGIEFQAGDELAHHSSHTSHTVRESLRYAPPQRPLGRVLVLAGILAAGVLACAYIEHCTRAAQVSRATGAPYFQVLAAGQRLTHITLNEPADDNAEEYQD